MVGIFTVWFLHGCAAQLALSRLATFEVGIFTFGIFMGACFKVGISTIDIFTVGILMAVTYGLHLLGWEPYGCVPRGWHLLGWRSSRVGIVAIRVVTMCHQA